MMDLDSHYQVIENGVLKTIDSQTGKVIHEEMMIMANQYSQEIDEALDKLVEIVGDNVYWCSYNEWGAYKFCVLVPFSKLQKFIDICNQLFDFEGRVPISIQGDSIFVDLTNYASEYYDELNNKIKSIGGE